MKKWNTKWEQFCNLCNSASNWQRPGKAPGVPEKKTNVVSSGGLGGTRISRQSQPRGQGGGWRLLWEGQWLSEPGVPLFLQQGAFQMSPFTPDTAHRSALPWCPPVPPLLPQGEVGKWFASGGASGRSASMFNSSSCSFYPVHLWYSHAASSIKEKGEVSYSHPGKGSVDPLSLVLSANIEDGQG